MSAEIITQIMDESDSNRAAAEDQLVQVNEQIALLQEKQDALAETLEQIHDEVIDFINLSEPDFIYKGTDFYSGSGIGNSDSNLENYRAFKIVEEIDAIIGQMYYNILLDPPMEEVYDGIAFIPHEEISIDDVSMEDKYEEFSYTLDFIHHPMGLTGTYGTKDNISMLLNGKGVLESNKNKFLDAQNKLARFGE